MERIQIACQLGKLLEWCRAESATDVHAHAGSPFTFRRDGQLTRIPTEAFPTPNDHDLVTVLREAFSRSACERIEREAEMDLSFLCGEVRYRANFSKQQGTQSFSFRVVPQSIPSLVNLQLPPSLGDLISEPRGLLLVTGASGQGKSTTACAFLQQLNTTRDLRIVTIEDPIEYVFIGERCAFEQREVGVDTATFAGAIRNAVRQDPEVIFIGEIRDHDTAQATMQAAETGHLVLATLHADSVAQTLDRIRELHPAAEQSNASTLLARCLNAIICQRLLPGTDGRRLPCVEILRRNPATQDAIARNDLHMLTRIIEACTQEGMQTFDQHLIRLLQSQQVTEDTARHYANNWSRLEMELHGFVSSQPGILKPDPGR
jgi:pilus retraction protein PilT